ncbi:MAG TPA: TonB-dependent receptor [Thermoanaerobaculia bacterium]
MKRCPPLCYRAVLTALLVTLFAVSGFAQTSTGNIFGRVVGNDGSALPGVTVTLTGIGAPQSTVTDSQGSYRFINLSPGNYTLRAELAGYGSATRSGVTVNIGRNADVTLNLNPSVSQTITVTAEAPLLDTRRTGTGSTVTQVELEEVPTARDPWVILQQVPGVLMDRINVGGNESGQQSQFVSKGAVGDQATFSIDGVNTTDMIATGSSSAYFDFGSFEEIQVTTGGTDPRVQTPGAQMNLVTKRGTNDFSGSARYYLTPGDTQGERKIPSEAASYLGLTNEIDEVTEWGFEVGGPIIRDRLWLWGAYADNKIDLFTAQSQASINAGQRRYADQTSLETINAKLNAQITRNNSATVFYTDNEKIKIGRNASPTRPPETTWNQSGFGPAGTYKLEDTHIFSSNFYLTGMYSKVNGGFQLQPDAGAGCTELNCVLQNSTKAPVLSGATGEWRNTFLAVQGERPQEQYRLDGSAFFNTGALNHELKFGFGYRSAGAEGVTVYPQNQFIYDLSGVGGLPEGFGLTYFYAISPYNYEYEYNDIYVGDTVLWGNLTVQAGLRFDGQRGAAGDQNSPANPTAAGYLPAQTFAANTIPELEWESISPRLGLTYALGQDRKTLLRGAYNRYVGQLGSNSAGYTALIPGYRYAVLYSFDENHNDVIEPGEVLTEYGLYNWSGFDPANPNATLAPTVRLDDNIEAPTTDEFILGFERELLTDFVASVNYTHRLFDKFIQQRSEKTRGAGDYYTSADYVIATTITPPAGTTEAGNYSVPVYRLKPGVAAPVFSVLTNREDYTQTYDGLELGLVKRMSNRWMMRGNFSFNDWKQQAEGEAFGDPTHLRVGSGCSSCDDSAVVQGSGTQSGAKGAVWINSEWAVNVAGVYQVPFIETNLGANFTMRQGYPILYVHSTNAGDGTGNKSVLVSDVDEHRLPNPYSLDLRLSKDFRFRGIGLELAVDAFNVTNEQTILQRNASLVQRATVAAPQGSRVAAANRIREIQNPRVLRFGARFTF